MKKFTAIAGVFVLAGCASTADIYTSAVDETATSAKAMAEVSQCLQMRLAAAPIVTPDGKTTFIVKNNYGAALMLISLSETSEGTLIENRAANSLAGGGIWRKCA